MRSPRFDPTGKGAMARKPSKVELATYLLSRYLNQLHPVIWIITILVICMAVYAISWGFKTN
jgi:hypothetical protein